MPNLIPEYIKTIVLNKDISYWGYHIKKGRVVIKYNTHVIVAATETEPQVYIYSEVWNNIKHTGGSHTDIINIWEQYPHLRPHLPKGVRREILKQLQAPN
jgi:hypothetical protein